MAEHENSMVGRLFKSAAVLLIGLALLFGFDSSGIVGTYTATLVLVELAGTYYVATRTDL